MPSFAFDYSEYILAAVIERSFDPFDIHLVLFLLGAGNSSYSPLAALSTEEGVQYMIP